MFILGNLVIGLTTVFDSFLFIFTIIVVASVVVSWVNADPRNPIVRVIHNLTQPVLGKIRKHVRTQFGGIDIAPLLLLLVIMFIQSGIVPSLYVIGQKLTNM